MWVLGIQTKAFLLCNKLCMNWTISTAPDLLLTPVLKMPYHWYFCFSGNNDKIRERVIGFNQVAVTKIFTGGSSDYRYLSQLLSPLPRLSVIQLWLQPAHRRLWSVSWGILGKNIAPLPPVSSAIGGTDKVSVFSESIQGEPVPVLVLFGATKVTLVTQQTNISPGMRETLELYILIHTLHTWTKRGEMGNSGQLLFIRE